MNIRQLDWWPTYTHAEQFLLAHGFERRASTVWRSKQWDLYLVRDVSGIRGRAVLRQQVKQD